MPFKPKHPCNKPGCGNLTHERFCDEHKQHADRMRDNATDRGYDSRWKKYRDWLIRQFECPDCGRNHALCEECARQGTIRPSNVIDHITPHRGDRGLFWQHSNHQGLCRECHNRKSQTEVIDR